jgi:hypothetical protein
MNLSKFVLNKTNFDCYKSSDPIMDCFVQLSSCRKVQIMYSVPFQLYHDILHNKTTISTLVQLCKHKQLNVWILHESQCIHVGTYPPTHVVDHLTILKWEGQTYDNYYHNILPLYALSHYKKEELCKIAKALNIPISKTKNQLYNDISLKLIK